MATWFYYDDSSEDELPSIFNGLNIGASTSKGHIGNGQRGRGYAGNGQRGRGQPGNYKAGRGHPGNYQGGRGQPGNYQAGRGLPGNYQAGRGQRGNYQCGRGHTRKGLKLPQQLKTVESIASYYEDKYRYSTYKVQEHGNPVYSYTVKPEMNGQVNLPLVVRSAIDSDTVRPVNSREQFNAKIRRHFDDMQGIHEGGAEEYDERGHIVSWKLGGPNETYNIFPQLRAQNRHGADVSDWRYLEQDLEVFMENNPWGSIDHLAVLLYDSDERPFRPTEIGVSVRLYNEQRRIVDLNGRRVTIANNDLENNFFVNE